MPYDIHSTQFLLYMIPLQLKGGDFFGFFLFSAVSEDAAIEPRNVATLALTARRSNHSARSHLQTRLDLIHKLARSHPQTRLDLIHKSARSHPQTRLDLIHKLGYISSTYTTRSHPPLGLISSTNSAKSHPPLG
jgi:hypothetical protein